MKVFSSTATNMRVVGGARQKAFWVFGTNHDWQWSPDEPQPRPTSDFEDVPYGQWRIELEPADTGLAHTFLTVLQPTMSNTAAMTPTATLASSANVQAMHIKDPAGARVVVFSKSQSGAVPAGEINYTVPAAAGASVGSLVFDLAPGAWYRVVTAASTGGVAGMSIRLLPTSGPGAGGCRPTVPGCCS